MGRKNKNYSKDLHQQAYDRLNRMQAFGESKREAVANGTAQDKIFSYNTYQTYWKHTKYFTKWIQKEHPECTTLKSAKEYVNEWLQSRVDQGLSAYTVQTDAKALGKMYGIRPDDPNYFQPPKRERAEITRSRGDRVRDKHFSKENNAELIKFCQGTGLRRHELGALKGRDLVTKEQIQAQIVHLESKSGLSADEKSQLKILQDTKYFKAEYYTRTVGKGGRERISPIVGKNVEQIVERIRETPPDAKVWQHVNSNADIHSYRSDYAVTIYKEYAREIKEIPYDRVNKGTGRPYQSGVYVCRKDESGKKLDKEAMLICSKALGHNRIEVVANNYIRGL